MRAFIAVEIGAETIRWIEAGLRMLAARFPGVRWVDPKALHLTVKFLGEIPDAQAGSIGEVMERAVVGLRPFPLTLTHPGGFGSKTSPRVVWYGVGGDLSTLGELGRRIEGGLEPLGFPREERPFSAHVTLGRNRARVRGLDGAALSGAFSGGAPGWRVDRVVLFSSHLSPKGATYSPVATSRIRDHDGG